MDKKDTKRIKANIFWKYVDIFSYHIKHFSYFYERIIGREYLKEEKKFNFLKTKNILHIGCGSYPITALTLAKNNNSRKILTIDRDEKSIKRAKTFINKNKLYDKIEASIGNGSKYCLDGFDMIIVSGCSVPKYEVVDHIFKNSKPKTKIIVRKECNKDGWFENLLHKYNDIEILDEMYCNPYPFCKWKSVFLRKN